MTHRKLSRVMSGKASFFKRTAPCKRAFQRIWRLSMWTRTVSIRMSCHILRGPIWLPVRRAVGNPKFWSMIFIHAGVGNAGGAGSLPRQALIILTRKHYWICSRRTVDGEERSFWQESKRQDFVNCFCMLMVWMNWHMTIWSGSGRSWRKSRTVCRCWFQGSAAAQNLPINICGRTILTIDMQ